MSIESLRYPNEEIKTFDQLITHLTTHSTIEALFLSAGKINTNQAKMLAPALTKLTHLKTLDLTNAQLTNKSGPLIANAIPMSIENLTLQNCFAEEGWIPNLGAKLKSCQNLKILSLGKNSILDKYTDLIHIQVQYIASLTHFDINNKEITTRAMKAAAEHSTTLHTATPKDSDHYEPLEDIVTQDSPPLGEISHL